MKNIFITGSSSYLGQNLISKLPQYNFFGLINETKTKNFQNFNAINTLPDNLQKYFSDNDIKIVIHLASNSERANELVKSRDIMDTNILLGSTLLSNSLGGNIEVFISAGSFSQDIYPETHDLYTLTKSFFEKLQYLYAYKYDLKNVCFHIGDVYGPNDNRDKLIPYLLREELNSKIQLKSDGSGLFSPVYIDDVINEFNSAIKNPNKDNFTSKNITSELLTVKEFINIYKLVRNKDFEVLFSTMKHDYTKEIKNFETLGNVKYPLDKGLLLI